MSCTCVQTLMCISLRSQVERKRVVDLSARTIPSVSGHVRMSCMMEEMTLAF